VNHPNVIQCLDSNQLSFRQQSYSYFVFPAF
jgi:serine/threonine protein kinase